VTSPSVARQGPRELLTNVVPAGGRNTDPPDRFAVSARVNLHAWQYRSQTMRREGFESSRCPAKVISAHRWHPLNRRNPGDRGRLVGNCIEKLGMAQGRDAEHEITGADGRTQLEFVVPAPWSDRSW